ncbi:MAG: 16S rRNA (cytosine(1402)-N(4))-methyltransferase RsmH [Chloroflexota bacterium]
MATHKPVLYQEVLHYLLPRSGKKYVDCTVGLGGHAEGILEASSPHGELLGLDVDPTALELAAKALEKYAARFRLVQSSYTTLITQLEEIGWQSVEGVLLDLGVSSLQLDTPSRGFSFRADAPLDMRFNPLAETTAADLVNRLPEEELASIIFEYGEERFARQIARAIVVSRPLETTAQLARIVERVVGRREQEIHPATRTFQALRIAVNQELDEIRAVLPQALEALSVGGRLVVISFHSLEDRLVKTFLQTESRDCICPPRQPLCTCGHRARLKLLTRKPIRPSQAEIEYNPRARSARLRAAEKIER